MSSEAIRETIATRLNTLFPAAQPSVPIFFENQPITQPSGTPWVYVDIIDNYTCRADLTGSGGRFRAMGVISIDVHVPEDTGTKTMREIIGSLASILTDKQFPLVGENGSVMVYGQRARAPRMLAGWRMRSVDYEFRAYTDTP